jgi:cytochrome c-type biogenesis protein CcmE
MTRKGRRLTLIASALTVIAIAIGLALFAFRDGVVFFVTPTDLAARTAELRPNARVRIGGLVQPGSVERGSNREVSFTVTDNRTDVKVTYQGLLPDLFREGQGIVAEGMLVNGVFKADTVLAKHDENYMPREVADSLKQQGVWQHGGEGPKK